MVIYVNKKVNGRLCETKSLTADDVLEYVTVECEINRNKTALVSCVYRCPGSDIVSFNHNIEQLFNHIRIYVCIYVAISK